MKVIKETILTNNKENLRLLVVSDLHICNNKDILIMDEIIMFLKNNKCDAICLVGDIIDSTNFLRNNNYLTNKLIDFIKKIGQEALTYIVFGNHDVGYINKNYKKNKSIKWMDDYETLKKCFIDKIINLSNVFILDNKTMEIKKGYTISGIIPSVNYAIKIHEDKDEDINEVDNCAFLKKLNSNNVNILLCHYPDVIKRLHSKRVLYNIDVCIAGHNHSGAAQITILEKILNLFKQNNRGIITPNKSIKLNETKQLRGRIKLDNKTQLIINPSIKTLSNSAGSLKYLNGLFYKGITQIEFKKNKS
ncbi:MAG: metallophosphoesterase [Bacilli bacterium]|nr:metallophosphoesterase [Bacilli bacterium]